MTVKINKEHNGREVRQEGRITPRVGEQHSIFPIRPLKGARQGREAVGEKKWQKKTGVRELTGENSKKKNERIRKGVTSINVERRKGKKETTWSKH